MIKNLFDSELLAINPDTGSPRINEVLIVPFTEQQSGVKGDLTFIGDMLSFQSENIPQLGMDSAEFGAFNPITKNLDMIGGPLELLDLFGAKCNQQFHY
jgi:hypothetical protein